MLVVNDVGGAAAAGLLLLLLLVALSSSVLQALLCYAGCCTCHNHLPATPHTYVSLDMTQHAA
jgi:hypothetical protein